jgi:anti-anti-sigma factor
MRATGATAGAIPAVSLPSEVDMASVDEILATIGPLAAAGGPILVDLSGVTFIDSTGLHTLVAAADALGDRGCIIAHGAHGPVAKVMELTQLDTVKANLHVIGCDILA